LDFPLLIPQSQFDRVRAKHRTLGPFLFVADECMPHGRYYIMQPPCPHWGFPHGPAAGPQAILEFWLIVGDAVTLNSFCNFWLLQCGQTGFSELRISNSQSRSHTTQWYSYSGMVYSPAVNLYVYNCKSWF
jgi:hypothetical protein